MEDQKTKAKTEAEKILPNRLKRKLQEEENNEKKIAEAVRSQPSRPTFPDSHCVIDPLNNLL